MTPKINAGGLDIIKRFEGLKLKAYKCPAGVWTIGWGHTGDVKPGATITAHQAEAILDADLDRFELGVDKLAPGLPSNQFSALVSFSFNVGLEALAKSTLLKKLKSGGPLAAAPEFAKWVRAGGKVLPGLVKRREAERQLFLTPEATS